MADADNRLKMIYYPKWECYIADNAVVAGNVRLSKDVNIWFHAVIRSEKASAVIGERTNIQDNCTLHTDEGYDLTIGKGVTIGHNAIVHGCTIKDNCLIGMGSIIMNGAIIKENCIVAAGAVVTEHKEFEPGSLIMGMPAKAVRRLSDREIESIFQNASSYIEEAKEYASGKF